MKTSTPRAYLLTYAALLSLTAATVGAAFLPLGRLSFVAALGVASIKAGLVALRFMHVGDSPRAARLLGLAGLAALALLVGPVLIDAVVRRTSHKTAIGSPSEGTKRRIDPKLEVGRTPIRRSGHIELGACPRYTLDCLLEYTQADH